MDGKFEGFIVTAVTDTGPAPVLSITTLDELTVMKLSIVGMTITSMGSSFDAERSHYRLHGPIPVPDRSDYEAFTMNFTLSAPDSSDVRIAKHGRLASVWVTFDVKNRYELVASLGALERFLVNEIKNIVHESQLSDHANMQRIFKHLQQITTSETFITAPPVEEDLPLVESDRLVYIHSVNQEGELVPVTRDSETDFGSYPIFVIVNTVLQRIFVLKTRNDISNRVLFLANRAARNLNTQRWKGKFTIYEIHEPFESQILIEQARIILQ
ncbi:MAG: hypothetical protein ACFFD4_24930 [Candidatus Odinarchaeota archaeon]